MKLDGERFLQALNGRFLRFTSKIVEHSRHLLTSFPQKLKMVPSLGLHVVSPTIHGLSRIFRESSYICEAPAVVNWLRSLPSLFGICDGPHLEGLASHLDRGLRMGHQMMIPIRIG
jgi:hypothetical protein